MKKLFSLVLVLVMTMALAVPAAAAAPTSSITISNATKGETYTAYKLLDMVTATSETGTEGEEKGSVTVYTYTMKTDNPFKNLIENASSLFDISKRGEDDLDGIRMVSLKSGKAGDVADWLDTVAAEIAANPDAYAEAKLPAPTKSDDLVIWSGIPYGYYLVISSLGTKVTVDTAKTPGALLIDKNQIPYEEEEDDLEKTSDKGYETPEEPEDRLEMNLADSKSVAYGDSVPFSVKFPVTKYHGENPVKSYTLHDQLPAGMVLDQRDDGSYAVSVTVSHLDEDDKEIKTVLDAADFSVTPNQDNSFDVTILWNDEGGNELIGDGSVIRSENDITISYSATVTTEADPYAPMVNTAYYTWQDWDGDDGTTPDGRSESDSWSVETYALAVYKVNEEGKPLDNAVFELTDSNGDPVNVVSEGAGVYHYDAAGNNEIVTPASGMIVVKGIANGIYTITETDAPDGYKLQVAPVQIQATQTYYKEIEKTITVSYDAEGKVTLEEEKVKTTKEVDITDDVMAYATVVVNYPSNKLIPSTGGSGTTSYYAIGGVLMAAAAALLVVKKAKKKEQ